MEAFFFSLFKKYKKGFWNAKIKMMKGIHVKQICQIKSHTDK